MQFMQLEQGYTMWLKMGFKKNGMYQLATLFGLGRLPGGGTWASLVVLFAAILAKNPSDPLIFFGFIMMFFAPTIYENSLSFFTSINSKTTSESQFFLKIEFVPSKLSLFDIVTNVPLLGFLIQIV